MSEHVQTQREWEAATALRAAQQVRAQLYLDQRYLNAALGALPAAPRDGLRGLATDGARLFYGAPWLLETYRKNRRFLARVWLHSLLHCVFRHLWLRGGRDAALWGLACDVAVEQTIDGLNSPAVGRPVGWVRRQLYAELKARCPLPAAGPIYRYLCTLDADRLQTLRREFYADSHRFWPTDENAPAAQTQGRRWENLGRQTQLSMQQGGRMAGESAGAAAVQAQVRAGQSRRAYRDFLRRFAVWHEEPRLDPDEFDLGTYVYGLRTYGNLPLIEPLESRESKKVRRFAVVIDTSASTGGALVKAFLKETFTLLKSQDSFFRQCRVLVLQADDAVREETWLDDLDDPERCASGFTLVGGGGTDFRPALARLEALRAEGPLRELQGVLYFTDGKGAYPTRRPPFDVAFLFLDTGAPPPDVPPWAMRMVLQPEELLPPPREAPGPLGAFPDGYDDGDDDPAELPEL